MTMVAKIYRRLTPRAFAIVAVLLTVLLCLYYANLTSDVTQSSNQPPNGRDIVAAPLHARYRKRTLGPTCPKLTQAQADIDTVQVYKDFDFQPAWMKSKEYWDEWFEQRYESQRQDPNRPPLKVILIPHSHNDPGWLKTFEHYFHYESKQILNNMVAKLQQHSNLTFIWSEVSFLAAWWDSAHPSKQRALRRLVQSGRLELTTGGWVMTDEATSHVYAMVDQLIEGHQWLKTNLGISPKSGWSIDPFGHGSTQPYLLTTSGITGTVIQRIHYAWKQWLAQKQFGDFLWMPNWQTRSVPNRISQKSSLLTHNQPFDIYSIKHSCGPHPYICLNFDFRKIPGEYTDYSIKAQNINDKNIKQKAELLLAQYARTGSLFPHNVVLMPIGDDFRYNHEVEWDQQYSNYAMLCDYINSNKDVYKAEISFGTPKDYFNAILERYDNYPTLKGDFFVYSDIFSEGRPAYWSGYFTTRPFMKILDRELETNLRGAEILYTIAVNKARQNNYGPHLKILERNFEKLVRARRNLGLFQHHDAITGTSKSFVMRDYGLKLFESLRDTESIQQDAIQSLLLNDTLPSTSDQTKNIVLSDLERESYEKLPKKLPIIVENERKIVLFNSLVHSQDHVVELRISSLNVHVLDPNRSEITFQINPVWNASNGNNKLHMANEEYELVFIAKLPPLSLVTYYLVSESEEKIKKAKATIYCNNCHRKEQPKKSNQNQNEFKSQVPEEAEFKPSKFKIKNTQPGDIQLENQKMKLLFDGSTGFMKSVTRKHKQKVTQCAVSFAAYHSAQFHSGAYLFMPDPNSRETDKDVLEQYSQQISIIITSGPISSEVTVIYGPFLVHSVKIYHLEDSILSDAIQIQNEVDFENPPKNRETELFMRLTTDVQNGDPNGDSPEFYSDLNGFQMQKRVKVERIGIEGNYFPITTMAYIQDEEIRLSLLTNHAQGAASWQPGFLEVMLDRRTLYDDSRGMGEGLVDNRKTIMKFWLLIEDVHHPSKKKPNVDRRFKRDDDDDVTRTSNRTKRDINQRKTIDFKDDEAVRKFNLAWKKEEGLQDISDSFRKDGNLEQSSRGNSKGGGEFNHFNLAWKKVERLQENMHDDSFKRKNKANRSQPVRRNSTTTGQFSHLQRGNMDHRIRGQEQKDNFNIPREKTEDFHHSSEKQTTTGQLLGRKNTVSGQSLQDIYDSSTKSPSLDLHLAQNTSAISNSHSIREEISKDPLKERHNADFELVEGTDTTREQLNPVREPLNKNSPKKQLDLGQQTRRKNNLDGHFNHLNREEDSKHPLKVNTDAIEASSAIKITESVRKQMYQDDQNFSKKNPDSSTKNLDSSKKISDLHLQSEPSYLSPQFSRSDNDEKTVRFLRPEVFENFEAMKSRSFKRSPDLDLKPKRKGREGKGREKRDVDYMEQPFEEGEVVRNFNVATESTKSENFSKPSLFANRMSNMLNYPVGIFVMEDLNLEMKPNAVIQLLSNSFPCDVHLLTLRTQPDQMYSQFPSMNALMVLHRQGYDCGVSEKFKCEHPNFSDGTRFVDLQIDALQVTSLTGLHPEERLNDIYDIDIQPMALQTLNVTFVK